MYVKRDSKYFIYLYGIDIFSIVLSYFLASIIKFQSFCVCIDQYVMLLIITILAQCCSIEFTKNFKGFFDRGYLKEAFSLFKELMGTAFITLLCLFVAKKTSSYSRMFLFLYAFICGVTAYGLRILFKMIVMKKYRSTDVASKVMLITTSDHMDELLENIREKKYWDYSFNSVAVIDKDMIGENFGSKIINANADNMFDLARTEILDEVLIHIGYHNSRLKEIVQKFQEMGVTVHVVLNNLSFDMPNVRVEKFSGYSVLTTSNNTITHSQLMEKRLMDVVGSVIGLVLTGIISIFVVPAIKLESKGPAIYSQIRVGRNGRKFKIYKFRSMYTDADERKAELMKQNKMDGLMFKMDDDPRITKVGKFIRKTSIDELPQFWNVLKGEMSLVGTRPPTVDEFEQYDLHHKNRLSFKPGLTGMWQATGRSDITDFEEVVKLDTQYIENWSLKLDIKLILLTIVGVLRKKGAE